MLTQLEVFTSGVPTPPLNVSSDRPSEDYIQILEIQGLGPVKANIQTADYNTIPGAYVVGSNVPPRNIVISVGLNPDWRNQTIESLRQILYQYFIPESVVEMVFTSTHLPTVTISGHVESMEPNLFEKEPVYQISIICPDPYFTAVDETVIKGTTQTFTGTTPTIIDNVGNVETGFVLDIVSVGSSNTPKEVRVVNKTDPFQLFMVTNVLLNTTSSFQLSTVDKNRYARQLYTDATENNLIQSVERTGTWVKLNPNSNEMLILATLAGYKWELRYNAKFGGL